MGNKLGFDKELILSLENKDKFFFIIFMGKLM